MGPRLEGRGNFKHQCTGVQHRQLQWGRVLKDAEMSRHLKVVRAALSASMGPRLEGRGN